MSIFLDENSKIIIQDVAGSKGRKHTMRMLACGTKIVAGINPKKAGISIDFDITPYEPLADQLQGDTVSIPVYGTVAEAKAAAGAGISVTFVPPVTTKRTVLEAVDAGLDLVMVITEHILVQDVSFALVYAWERGVRAIGPNCSGVISPGKSSVGITSGDIIPQGHLGPVSKSGTLTYQMMYGLRDLGFTICIGIGDDPIIGAMHTGTLAAFEQDPEIKLIMMVGEIGRGTEERAAAYIREHVTKPVVVYVAGFTVPGGKTVRHTGTIVSGSSRTATAKKEALEVAGAKIDKTPSETTRVTREIMSAR